MFACVRTFVIPEELLKLSASLPTIKEQNDLLDILFSGSSRALLFLRVFRLARFIWRVRVLLMLPLCRLHTRENSATPRTDGAVCARRCRVCFDVFWLCLCFREDIPVVTL